MRPKQQDELRRRILKTVGATMNMSIEELEEQARVIRRDIITCTTIAGSGHPSSSLSGVEIMAALYFGGIMQFDAAKPQWEERDRLIMSKGHASPLLYVVLAHAGYFSTDLLPTLRQIESPLEGHPNMSRLPGVEASTGSLGQGLSPGLGMALAARLAGKDYRTYVMIGDGEAQEGQIWEASMVAARYGVDDLCAILDWNGLQQYGWAEAGRRPEDRMNPLVDPAGKWRAFGWHVIELDGHDLGAIVAALEEARSITGRPTMLIAHTVKGKGVSFMEGDYLWHAKPISDEECELVLCPQTFARVC